MATDFKKYINRIKNYDNYKDDLCPIGAVLVGSVDEKFIGRVNKKPLARKAFKALRQRLLGNEYLKTSCIKYIMDNWDSGHEYAALRSIQSLGWWSFLKEGLNRLHA